jgi:2-methylcitrate dehydratase PrpD
MTKNLGQGSVFPDLSLKPYATSRQTLSAADAMLGLVADGLKLETVRGLSIRIPNAHLGLVSAPFNPEIRARNFMSIGTQVAIAAVRPAQLYNAEREDVVRDPDVMAFAARCKVVGDNGLDTVFPNVWGARLDLDTSAGPVSRTVLEPYGSPKNRMDDRQVLEKAKAILSHGGQVERADEIMSCGATAFTDPTSARRLGECLLRG